MSKGEGGLVGAEQFNSSTSFQVSAICSFKWLQKDTKFDPDDGAKMAIFLKKITKIAQQLGASPSDSLL